ncbi:MAG: hemerythrin domain-containing protein [Dehalococcoidia bacterium]|nr:hemerythrin domain-containing protein [Dehalococcoidia bacterium]
MQDLSTMLPEPLAGLIREHRMIEEVVSDARNAIGQAAIEGAAEDVIAAGIEAVRDLFAFMQVDLTLHIAKEEEILFPVLEGLNDVTDLAVEDMFVQHDAVGERHALLEKTLAAIADGHDEVTAEQAGIEQHLAAADGGVTLEILAALKDNVMRLDWILQGHFGDEEDDVFVPAEELLPPERFPELARAMAELEARSM